MASHSERATILSEMRDSGAHDDSIGIQRYIDIRCAVLKVDDVPIPAQ